MIDQATELRKLVLRAMRENPVTSGPPPRLIVLTGAKGGVGVTSIAVNLSIALSQQGSRVVVVDADPYRSDVATLCGLRDLPSPADVLAARRDIHEVLQRGPAGIQIIPGLATADGDMMSHERLQRQLLTLGRHADIVVIDVGCATDDLAKRFCHSASEVLLLTTPDNIAVMDAYARVKIMLAGATEPSLQLVVNQARAVAQACDVHHRVDDSCRKFLGRSIEFAGHVPLDGCVSQAALQATPCVLWEPSAASSQAIHQLATRLTLLHAKQRAA